MSSDICNFCTCVTGCLQFTDIQETAFSSPEPVVSWSSGLEMRGSGSSHHQIPVNCGHPVTHVQNSQISLLMLIKAFHFLSSLQRVASLGCFETRTDFTQLRFIDNLESKGYDINKNQLNTLLGCRTETVNWEDYCLSLKMRVHVW